jgi:hypothetical protein
MHQVVVAAFAGVRWIDYYNGFDRYLGSDSVALCTTNALSHLTFAVTKTCHPLPEAATQMAEASQEWTEITFDHHLGTALKFYTITGLAVKQMSSN